MPAMDNPAARDQDDQEVARNPKKQSGKSGTNDDSNRSPAVPAPFAPDSDEESPLGDTDEHSDA
jgi:hypothetical protein